MEEKFWDWFQENRGKLENYLSGESNSLEFVDKLNEQIYEYDELLFAEITGDTDGSYVLILTCDGRPKGIHPLTKLAHFAPVIENWTVQQFRKPGRIFELNYRGLALRESDFKIKHWIENENNQIDVYIKGYEKKDERYQSLAFLYLDHFIGEYEIMTKIESVGFKKLNFLTNTKKMHSLKKFNEILN